MLIDVIESPRASVRNVRESGIIPETNDAYELVAGFTSASAVAVTLTVSGRRIGAARLDIADYPRLDLNSIESFAEKEGDGVTFVVSIKYGEPSGCFIDDDGRNRIRLHFLEGQRSIFNEMTFSNCEPQVREVNLRSP